MNTENETIYLGPTLTCKYSRTFGTAKSEMLFRSFFREMYLVGFTSNGCTGANPLNFTIRLRRHGESGTSSGFIQMQDSSYVYWQVVVQTPAYAFPPSFLVVESHMNGFDFRGYLLVDWSLFNNPENVNFSNGYDQINISEITINVNAIQNIECSPIIANLRRKENLSATSFTTQFNEFQCVQRQMPTYIPSGNTSVHTIYVNSQDDLNGIANKIVEKVSEGKKVITILFKPGTYMYNQKCVNFPVPATSGEPVTNFSNISLHFIGHGSTLIGSTKSFQGGTETERGYIKYLIDSSYVSAVQDHLCSVYNWVVVSEDGFSEDLYGEFTQAPNLVEVYFDNSWHTLGLPSLTESPLCRIARKESVGSTVGNITQNAIFKDTFIQIYAWYQSYFCKVLEITDDYIYFKCISSEDLTTITEGDRSAYSFNGNHLFGKMPCYRLINEPYRKKVFIQTGYLYTKIPSSKFYLCDAGNFISISGCSFKSVSISGFNFNGSAFILGNGNCKIDQRNNAIISFNQLNLDEYAVVSDCRFLNIKSDAFHANETSNVIFRDNFCINTHHRDVEYRRGSNLYVCDNRFENSAIGHNNDGAIICSGAGYHIARNFIMNFCYMGIGVGQHYNLFFDDYDARIAVQGIVEYNELYNTPEFRGNIANSPLMDGGGIYTWTIHTQSIIRFNVISGYFGMYGNRGIFCDDGTFNIKIYGNLILNSNNHFCLDLRECIIADCYNLTEHKHSDVQEDNNRGNFILYNIFDGRYKFQGRTSGNSGTAFDTSNIKGKNILLLPHHYVLNDNNTDNVVGKIAFDCKEDDFIISGCESKELSLRVPFDMYEKIKNLPFPEFIMARIKK